MLRVSLLLLQTFFLSRAMLLNMEPFLEGYDATKWPTSQNLSSPTKVTVNLFINSLGSVSAATMDYETDIYLRERWKDERLVLMMQRLQRKKLKLNQKSVIDRLWKPDLYFRNLKQSTFHMATSPNMFLEISESGDMLRSLRLTLKLSCYMKMYSYPFDTQTCYMLMSSYAHTIDALVFEWQREGAVQYNDQLQIPEFYLVEAQPNPAKCIESYETGNYSCLEIRFVMHRHSIYCIIFVYLPTTIVVMCSWISLWISHNNMMTRLLLGTTTLLTILFFGLAGIMNAMDVWIVVCILFVFASAIEFVVAELFDGRCPRISSLGLRPLMCCPPPKKDESQEELPDKNAVDAVCRILFPLLFLLFNVFYWPVYLIKADETYFRSIE